MSERLKQLYVPKRGEPFSPYLIPNDRFRRIDINKLSSAILAGQERRKLSVPTTGDVSLVLRYKERDGIVSSFSFFDSDLSIDQLQGAKQEGYRVTSSLNWVYFFADEVLEVAKHPESSVDRITMYPMSAIQGFIDASEIAMLRYEAFARRLGMRFSAQEFLYARDVRS